MTFQIGYLGEKREGREKEKGEGEKEGEKECSIVSEGLIVKLKTEAKQLAYLNS